MTLVMFDAIPALFGNVPPDPPAVASYVDGFGGYQEALKRWPHAHHLDVTIHGAPARCADFEKGAMRISMAPGWYHTHAIHRYGLVVLYTSAGNIEQLAAVMVAAKIPRADYLIWSAHYGHGEHICGPATCGFPHADGTQWTDLVDGRSCDQSLLSDSFFPKPPDKLYRATVELDATADSWQIQKQ